MLIKKTTPVLALLVAAGTWCAPATAADADAKPAAATTKPADKTTELFPDTVVAKGKSFEIKRSQLDSEVTRLKAQLAARGQNVPPERTSLIEQQILDQLIQLELLKAKATPEDQASGKKLAEKQLNDAKTQFGSEDALNLRLKAQGLTRDELLGKWTEGETVKLVLLRELKISISDADIKKFYDDNPSQFEEPEMARVSHILLSTRESETGKELSDEKKAAKRKLAEELVKRARANEDFAKLVKEYSEDPGSKDTGGEYKFPRGQMVKEFETAAFALKTNQVSDVVTTQFGYHVIKLSELYPAKKHELAEASPRIKEYLSQMEVQKQAGPLIEKFKKDANVEILDERLKLKLADDGGPPPAAAPAKPPGK
jgi:peptidyl-prolyl cis-trans isomerase C